MTEVIDKRHAQQRLVAYLKERHLRLTPERTALFNKVATFQNHFSVDDLQQALEMDGYYVSRATVYNTIELLVDAGLLHKLFLGGGQFQYELATRVVHGHLICTACGKIRDIKSNNISSFMRAQRFNAFSAQFFQLNVYGLCNACARKVKYNSRINNTSKEK